MLNKKRMVAILLSFLVILSGFAVYSIISLPEPIKSVVNIKTLPYDSLLNNCKKSNTSPTDCFAQYLEIISQAKGFEKAQEALENYSKVEQGFSGRCHSIGHLFGKWSFKTYGFKVQPKIIDICGFSIGHGYLEAAGEGLTIADFKLKFQSFCKNASDLSGCIHGMGHGLYTSGFSFVEADTFCQSLDNFYKKVNSLNNKSFNVLCMEGVMMEELLSNERWKIIESAEDAVAPCMGLSRYSFYGCRDIAYRNYIISAQLYLNNSQLMYKRLNDFSTFCKSLNNDALFYCTGHLGYILSEITGVTELNQKSALFAKQLCSGLDVTSCYTPYFSSIYSLSSQDDDLLYNYCNFFTKEVNLVCKNQIKSDVKLIPKSNLGK